MTKVEIDNLIITNQGLIGKAIKDLKCYWRTEDEFQDLYDAGMIGLIKGAKEYKKELSCRLQHKSVKCLLRLR